jgi:phosphatidylserine decarboxylase
MTIHREGKTTLIYLLLILGILDICFKFIFPPATFIVLAVCSFLFYIFIMMFFRSPDRKINAEMLTDCLVSPADGRIIYKDVEYESEYFKKEMLKVSIFMSMTNVHLNRIPVTGKIIYQKYHPGKRMVAFHPKSSEMNERNTVVIKDNKGNRFLVRQIAGLIARRIMAYAKEGDEVNIGQELGFIKFGSRVDIFMDPNTKLNIKLRQPVRGNKTIIASL